MVHLFMKQWSCSVRAVVRELPRLCGVEKSVVRERSLGSKSIRVVPALDRSARLSGGMAGRSLGQSQEAMLSGCQKKKYRAAIQSALSAKVSEGSVIVVAELVIAEAKTKLLAAALAQLGIDGHTLLVVGDQGSHVVQAGKNLSSVTVLRPEDLNVYDVLRCRSVVIPRSELDRVKEVWS